MRHEVDRRIFLMNQEFKCYLCGCLDGITVAEKNQIRFNCYNFEKRFVKCQQCNVIQLYPTWSKEEMDSLYNSYSTKLDFKGYKLKKNTCSEIGKHISKNKAILEVGCGNGFALKELRENGYNIVGIDKDPSVCDGKIILNYDFKDFSSDKKFDFIYALHVFEHIQDPHSFIDFLMRNLSVGGKFLLVVPSVDDPLIRLYKSKAYNNFYWYPYHIF